MRMVEKNKWTNNKSHAKLYLGLGLMILFLCSGLVTLLHTEPVGTMGALPPSSGLTIAAAPPGIANIQQTPDRDHVDYNLGVNVSCTITIYAPLVSARINKTINNWVSFSYTNLVGSGNGTYWAIIPLYTPGYFVQYRIVVQDQLGGKTISSEYNYTIKDLTPPEIIHLNSSAWVKPVAPFPWTIYIMFNCTVVDLASSVSWVMINFTSDGGDTNATYLMNGAASYWFNYGMGVGTTKIYYNILAQDSLGNRAMTPTYSITIDAFGPTITCWTVPNTPQYNDTVYICANITDGNTIIGVKFKWSLDWLTNYTFGFSNIGGFTWQTDSPLPAQVWHTTVRWEINATDNGNFRTIKQFSYRTEDFTPPNVTGIVAVPTVESNTPVSVNATIREPVGASGLKTQKLYYGLSSEGYAYHAVSMVSLGGDVWSATIPGQEGVTVRWFIYAEDNAGNNYTSTVEEYTVGGGGIPFSSFAFSFFGLIFGLIAAYYLLKRYKNQLTPWI